MLFILNVLIYLETLSLEDQMTEKLSKLDVFDDGKYFSIMVAGGPFMLSNSFDLSPLCKNKIY